jgi:hypothetical protein
MVLMTAASHPSRLSYVLKLHRDADPAAGLLCGRLENLASGRRFDFASAQELAACLAADAAAQQADPGSEAMP